MNPVIAQAEKYLGLKFKIAPHRPSELCVQYGDDPMGRFLQPVAQYDYELKKWIIDNDVPFISWAEISDTLNKLNGQLLRGYKHCVSCLGLGAWCDQYMNRKDCPMCKASGIIQNYQEQTRLDL